MSEPHHDTPVACPKCGPGGPISTTCAQRGQAQCPDAFCVACGANVVLAPAEWHRAKRADDHWDANQDRAPRKKAKPRAASAMRQVALFVLPPRAAVAHMPTMRELAALRVPLGVCTAAATCVSLGASMRVEHDEESRMFAVELRPLTKQTEAIAGGAGFVITSVLGKPAAVWVRT